MMMLQLQFNIVPTAVAATSIAHDWVIPLVYMSVAVLCGWVQLSMRASWRAGGAIGQPSAGYHRRRRFWQFAALLLAGLSLALAIGLIDAVATRARLFAWSQHWYSDRWSVQVPIVAALVLTGTIVLWRTCRPRPERFRRDRWSGAALCAVVCLLCVRAISQHHVDALLSSDLLSVSLGRWIELGALAALVAAAAHTIRCRRRYTAAKPVRWGTTRVDCSALKTVSTSTEVSNGL